MEQNCIEPQLTNPDGKPVRRGLSSFAPFSGAIVSRLSSLCRWHIATAILLIALFIFMANRSRDEDRWSDWGFGDAQTMLSLKHWDKDGWFANYLLFIPQGYAKVIRQFDDTNLRQHAHGTCPGSSPRIGPRLWYTHYPAGYLVPYAALFKVGLESKYAMQLFSAVLSVIALGLMYLTFARITTPGLSFLAVTFYALSRPFLGFADSLANLPLDDMLRFAFMYCVVMSTRDEQVSRRTRWLIAAWLIEFCLSLSSFDSVFFIFTWLVGWDLLEEKRLQLRKWFLFGMAPTTAHGLQFLQNVWYLGFKDAVIDIKDAFLLKNAGDSSYNSGQGRLDVIKGSIAIIFKGIFPRIEVFWAVCGGYTAYALILRDREDKRMPSPLLFALLFACGLMFILILPHAARMPYEARQMMPFAALLTAAATWAFFRLFRDTLFGNFARQTWGGVRAAKWFAIPVILVLLTVWLAAWGFHLTTPQQPPTYDHVRGLPDTSMAKDINRNLETSYDAVIFDAGAFQTYWDAKYVPGYPQILPLTEYYAGSRPILCFDRPEDVVTDLTYMVTNGKVRFSPVLTASDSATFDNVIDILYRDGVITARPDQVVQINGRPLADLTSIIKWKN
jgi:hypothetical protein